MRQFFRSDWLKPYPLIVDLDGKPVTVIGGGRVALRKTLSLLECGAEVTVISPELAPELKSMADAGRIQWLRSRFAESMLDRDPQPALVFGTTDDRNVNVEVHGAAVKRRIPCNIADVPDLCTFIVPAVVNRGGLTISVSTGGSSPALARRVRERLERDFGDEYSVLIRILGDLRGVIVRDDSSPAMNKRLFLEIVDSDLLTAIRADDEDRAVTILKSILPETIDPASVVAEAFESRESEG